MGGLYSHLNKQSYERSGHELGICNVSNCASLRGQGIIPGQVFGTVGDNLMGHPNTTPPPLFNAGDYSSCSMSYLADTSSAALAWQRTFESYDSFDSTTYLDENESDQATCSSYSDCSSISSKISFTDVECLPRPHPSNTLS